MPLAGGVALAVGEATAHYFSERMRLYRYTAKPPAATPENFRIRRELSCDPARSSILDERRRAAATIQIVFRKASGMAE